MNTVETMLRNHFFSDLTARAALIDHLIESGRDDEAELVRAIFQPRTESERYAAELVERDRVDVLELPRLASNNKYTIFPYRRAVSYSTLDNTKQYRLAGWARRNQQRIWLFEECRCRNERCVCDEADKQAYKLVHESNLIYDKNAFDSPTELNIINTIESDFNLPYSFARELVQNNLDIILDEHAREC